MSIGGKLIETVVEPVLSSGEIGFGRGAGRWRGSAWRRRLVRIASPAARSASCLSAKFAAWPRRLLRAGRRRRGAPCARAEAVAVGGIGCGRIGEERLAGGAHFLLGVIESFCDRRTGGAVECALAQRGGAPAEIGLATGELGARSRRTGIGAIHVEVECALFLDETFSSRSCSRASVRSGWRWGCCC